MRENNISNINKSFYFKINLKIPIRKLKLFYYLFRENSIEIMQFHYNDFSQNLREINFCKNRIILVYLYQQKVFGLTITTVNSVQTNIISRNFWTFQNIHTVDVKPYWENVYFELSDF